MALTTVTGSLVSVNAIQGTLIADNAITAVHIATNAVSGTLIADNAVTAVHIAQNTITVTQLADDCVESAKIADGIITTNHLNKAMISSQTEVSAASGDFVLLGDTSDSNNLKKTPVSSIIGLASGGVDGISTSADATAITIDSSERIGMPAIGQTHPVGGQAKLGINSTDAAGASLSIHRHYAGLFGGYLVFQKSRNTDITNLGVVSNNDILGSIEFTGADGNSYAQGAHIRASVDGTPGDADMPTRLTFSTSADGSGTPTERLRILSSGGITFNGDTAAANALDDYEEGTWTPAFYTYSGVTTTSMTVTLATYTKIGNICHIHANVNATLSSLPGQTVTITGLPFAASGTDQYAIIALGGHTENTGGNTPKAHFRTNGSQLDGVYYNASNNTAYWSYNGFDTTTFHLSIHGFYTTA
jgi:hypothetical protein